MELFEFNNIIQIVNRFKAVLKQKKVTQIDFAKDKLKISAGLFYNVLTNKSLVDASFFKKNLVIYKKIFEWTKNNDPIGDEPTTSNHKSNKNELAGPSNGENFTLYSKLTEYFKKSNINLCKFCKSLNIVRSTFQKFLKYKLDRIKLNHLNRIIYDKIELFFNQKESRKIEHVSKWKDVHVVVCNWLPITKKISV